MKTDLKYFSFKHYHWCDINTYGVSWHSQHGMVGQRMLVFWNAFCIELSFMWQKRTAAGFLGRTHVEALGTTDLLVLLISCGWVKPRGCDWQRPLKNLTYCLFLLCPRAVTCKPTEVKGVLRYTILQPRQGWREPGTRITLIWFLTVSGHILCVSWPEKRSHAQS